MKRSTVAVYISAIAFTAFALSFPGRVSAAASAGLSLFVASVLPTLLPFFFLTSVISTVGVPRLRLLSRATGWLFNTPDTDGYITLTGVFAGYPTGAKLIGEADLTTGDAEAISAHASLPGLMFVVGTVGTAILKSNRGISLWLIQLVAALINGIIFRKRQSAPKMPPAPAQSSHGTFVTAVSSATASALSVGLFVALGSVAVEVLRITGLPDFLAQTLSCIGADKSLTFGAISCILEMTCGIAHLAVSPSPLSLPCISFALGFGGLSVMAQSLSLSQGKVSASKYLVRKLTQGTIAFLLTVPLVLL